MKTFPDFTWEHIIQSFESFINQLEIAEVEFGTLPERVKEFVYCTNGMIEIVPQLRAHLQLEKIVPIKSLLGLKWFPSSNYEVWLVFLADKSLYRVSVLETDQLTKYDLIEEKEVAFDQVAAQVYALIQKYRDDA